jgi:protein-disulfide isomerase
LQQHPFARLAAHSAACADEQGKYWDQHQRIYEGQADWSAARDAGPIFRSYAKAVGLDLGRYDACMKAGKYAGRIQASYNEGVQLGVGSTPTLLVSGRLYRGRLDSDAILKLVDSLAPHRSQ